MVRGQFSEGETVFLGGYNPRRKLSVGQISGGQFSSREIVGHQIKHIYIGNLV